jgi:TPR repeat protein
VFCSLLAAGIFFAVATTPARADFSGAVEAYDNGRIAQAVAEWGRLADAGDPAAQVALADMAIAGFVPGAGLPEAIALYRRAAHAGDPVAQLNLGDFYARGHGLPRDPVRAYAWLGLAAEQGRVWAAVRRDEIATGLDAKALERAQSLMRDLSR